MARPSVYAFRPRLGFSRGHYAERPLVERGKAEIFLSSWAHRLRAISARSSYGQLDAHLRREVDCFEGRGDDWLSAYVDTLRCLLARDSSLGVELVARAIAFVSVALERCSGRKTSLEEMKLASGVLCGEVVVHGPECDRGVGLSIAASVAALAGVGVHLVTTREQRAVELYERFAPLFERLGLSAGALLQRSAIQERRAAWGLEVVYVGVAAMMDDLLKDRRAGAEEGGRVGRLVTRLTAGDRAAASLRLKGLQLALLDDASGLLCDFAIKPFVVRDAESIEEDYRAKTLATRLAGELIEGVDFRLQPAEGQAELTPAGEERLDTIQGIVSGPLARPLSRRLLVEGAVSAKHLYARDRHYVVTDGNLQFKLQGGCIAGTETKPTAALKSLLEVKEGLRPSQPPRSGVHSTFGRALKRYLALGGAASSCDGLGKEICREFDLPVVKLKRPRAPLEESCHLHETLEARDAWLREELTALNSSGEGAWILCATPESVAVVEEIGAEVGVAFDAWEEAHSDPRRSHVLSVQLGQELPFGPEGYVPGPAAVIFYDCLDALHIDRQLIDRLQATKVQRCVSLEDQLVVKLLPRGALWASKRSLRLAPFLGRWVARMVVRAVYARAEAARRQMRESYMKAEEDEHRQLSFAGPPKA